MIAAASSGVRRETKLIVITPEAVRVGSLAALSDEVRPGDVWIVNDAATFPASLAGRTRDGDSIELRLLPHRASPTWSGVLFGHGDWRTKTEDRPAPPNLRLGEAIRFEENLCATVRGISALSARLIEVEFNLTDSEVWREIYRIGRPIQYAYHRNALDLWSVQTPFASRPWASEMPSAGRPLHWRVLSQLKNRGARVHFLTHATGISATGDAKLDGYLPFPEFFEIPEATVSAIRSAKSHSHRVIAVGTSVMRALEGRASDPGGLRAGQGETSLKIGPDFSRRVVDGIFSGLHSPGESHFELLRSFLPRERFDSAEAIAESSGFLSHEFGDASLILTR